MSTLDAVDCGAAYLDARAAERLSRKKSSLNSGENSSDPSVPRLRRFREGSEKVPEGSENQPFESGFLIEKTDRGPRRMIESLAAVKVAGALKNRLAWDTGAASWLTWEETHWEPRPTNEQADQLLAQILHDGTHPLGFRASYLSGVVQIVQKRALLRRPESPDGVIPFQNRILDIRSGSLEPATPERALDWCLPHDHDEKADCPNIKNWLLAAVDEDMDTVELLRAWLAALLRGTRLQVFLMLIGRGGTGKGTFQRLVMALIGSMNAAVCTLRDLETNRFETAKLYGKRLCMINEAGKHGGALNMLKAVTGGDHLPLERKFVQQVGSFVFGGLVLMATNEDLQTTDLTSGLERRRVTVRFSRTATPADRADWERRGGEDGVLHAEIPGLINWLLELNPDEICAKFDQLPKRVATDNLLGLAAGNSVADWMMENTVHDPNEWAQIGVKKEYREGGAIYFDHAGEWLYANYLTWAAENGRLPVSSRKFSATIVDMAETLGHPVLYGRHPHTRAYSVKGMRLRAKDESENWNRSEPLPGTPEPSGTHGGTIQAMDRKDRKDGTQKSIPIFCEQPNSRSFRFQSPGEEEVIL